MGSEAGIAPAVEVVVLAAPSALTVGDPSATERSILFIFFGSRMYGQVDKTPDVGWVSTKFLHLQFVPLIPVGSYLIEEFDGVASAKVPFSWKSVLVAWMRAAIVLAIVTAGVIFSLALSDGEYSLASQAFVACAMCVGALEFLRNTRGIGRASESRAAELRAIVDTIDVENAVGRIRRAA